MTQKVQRLKTVFSSRLALPAFITLFVALALRIALTKTYPLPYDESFHFGLIQLYTHHLNPFLASQPAGADAFGAVARDPSYLYHYLMSFPLRIISLVAHTTIEQVIALRIMNIGLGVTTLVLLRKLTQRLGASMIMSNLAVLALAITPVFYDVSAQVNYDNLLLPLILVALLLTWNTATIIQRGQLPVVKLMRLTALLLLTSLVQYSFLPILLASCLYVTGVIVSRYRQNALNWNIRWRSWPAVSALLLVLVSGGLWTQRYGVNLVAYHTPHPQCGAVLNVQACSHYSPWYRNYQLRQSYASHPANGLQFVAFTEGWLRSMYYGTYSIVHSKTGAMIFTPVTAIRIAAKFILFGSLLYGLLRWRQAKGSGLPWTLLGLVGFAYTVTLWGQNFSDFHHLGALVGIQGRYMLLVLPIIYAASAKMYTLLIQDLRTVQSALGSLWPPVQLQESIVHHIGVMRFAMRSTRNISTS
jgi:hypothetical protein